MSRGAGQSPAPRAPRRRRLLVRALLVGVGVATAAMPYLANGGVGATAAPVLLVAAIYAAWKAPLRWSTAAFLFLLLALDSTYDAEKQWHSPLAIVGDLLRNNLDWVFPGMPRLGGLGKLNGMEVVAVLLIGLGAWRQATGKRIDLIERVQTARALDIFVILYVAAAAFSVVNGLASGGSADVAILQVRPLLHIPLLFALCHMAFRGPVDHALIGGVLVLAATCKAAIALWVRMTVESRLGERMGTTTNHGDSVLFAAACLVLLAAFLEQPGRRSLARLALFLPLILLGMRANHRRLAWVDLGWALAAMYLSTPWTAWKRTATRLALVAVPVTMLYATVGWESGSPIFAPVRMIRTVTDNKVDRSTLYRDVENWNLAMSVAESPVVGRGFGHGYSEYMTFGATLDISSIFTLYRAEPHNAVLGLLLFAGLAGFTAMWLLLGVGLFLAVRSHRLAQRPADRAAALFCIGAIVVVCVQFYGDLGQYFTQLRVVAGVALAVAGKLAVATGAWPARPGRRRASARGAPEPGGAGSGGHLTWEPSR